jgi:hypothetical protein
MTRKSAIAKARRLHARDGGSYVVLHCGCEEYVVKARHVLRDHDWADAVKLIEQPPAPLPTFAGDR